MVIFVKLYNNSVSLGQGTKTTAEGHIALGKYNSGSSTSILTIGNGTSDSNRSNLISLQNNTTGLDALKGYYLNLNNAMTVDLSNGDSETHPISTYFTPEPSGFVVHSLNTLLPFVKVFSCN